MHSSAAVTRLALVTGSAGHIGSWIVRELLADGWTVRGFDIKPHPHDLASAAFEPVAADVRDRAVFLNAAQGASAIFHLAMCFSPDSMSNSDLTDLAQRGVQNAVEALRSSNGQARLVHTSSTATLGETPTGARLLDEQDWDPTPATAYARAKIAGERLLWQEAAGMDAVAVLPAMTIGPGDTGGSPSTERILQMYRRAWLPFWFAGGLNVVDVRDVARGHLLAFEHGRAGSRYILGGENVEFRQLIATVRSLAGRRPPWIPVPIAPLLLAAKVYERLMSTVGKQPLVTTTQMRKRFGSYQWVSTALAQHHLGYNFRSLTDTLGDLLR